jgi:hypothetical protein
MASHESGLYIFLGFYTMSQHRIHPLGMSGLVVLKMISILDLFLDPLKKNVFKNVFGKYLSSMSLPSLTTLVFSSLD